MSELHDPKILQSQRNSIEDKRKSIQAMQENILLKRRETLKVLTTNFRKISKKSTN
jgi:hypothetical protein